MKDDAEQSNPSTGSPWELPKDPGLSLFIISLVCYLVIASVVAAVLWVRLWAAHDYIRLLQANRTEQAEKPSATITP